MNTRQEMGCVYEAPTAAPGRGYVLRWPSGAPSIPWRSSTGAAIHPHCCPLYLGRVAEASDVFGALPHLRRGTLEAWLGEAPAPALLELLESHEAGVNDWTHDPARTKGGA